MVQKHRRTEACPGNRRPRLLAGAHDQHAVFIYFRDLRCVASHDRLKKGQVGRGRLPERRPPGHAAARPGSAAPSHRRARAGGRRLPALPGLFGGVLVERPTAWRCGRRRRSRQRRSAARACGSATAARAFTGCSSPAQARARAPILLGRVRATCGSATSCSAGARRRGRAISSRFSTQRRGDARHRRAASSPPAKARWPARTIIAAGSSGNTSSTHSCT